MSRLDETRLENVCRRGDRMIARCPACFEQGHDKKGEHLVINADGSFGCVQFPKDEGIEHRKRIFALVGIRDDNVSGRSDSAKFVCKSKAKRTTFPTLDDAISFQVQTLKMLATRRDVYHDANRNVHFVVVRFDGKKGKQFRPFHHTADGWVIGDPQGELPLFQLPKLLVRDLEPSSEAIFVVEGEKCVCELETLDLLVTTSAHGSKSPHKSDWQPLTGRNVVILPDNDDDGQRYAQNVAALLLQLSPKARVKIVQLPDLPPKGDCVDWLDARDGQTPEDIKAELLALVAATPEETQLPKAALTDVGAMRNLADYPENDAGNAEMFVDRYSAVIRYSHAHESWFIWDGNRWLPDSIEGVHQLALELSNALIADSVQVSGRRDEHKLARGIEIGRRNQISNMLWLARSDRRIVIRRDEIDVDNFLLGVRNGVIDLRTGKRRDGCKGDFITKACGCEYDAAATARRWAGFLAEVFDNDSDLIDYIQRAVGYSLTGDTREQCLFFLHGGGANGKSTFIELLFRLLGDYATTASQNILCVNRYAKEPLDEIASLEDVRFVKIAETGVTRMDETRIKLLTGGDIVTGKPHYKQPMNFQPKFKLWIFGNSQPAIYGVDLAIWRRIKLIPFNVEFADEKQDSTLKEQLLGELPGILNWAIEGALNWQAEGRLVPPQCVVEATNAYRDDQDILREFIAAHIRRAKEQKLAQSDLYAAYKTWHAQGSSDTPFSSKKIAKMFRERGYKSFEGTDRKLFWSAIVLSDDEPENESNE